MRKRNNKKTIITISIILGLVIVGGIVFFLTKKNDGFERLIPQEILHLHNEVIKREIK